MRFVYAGLLICCCTAFAQVPDADAEDCKDSKLVNRIKGCMISECRVTEHDSANVPVASSTNADGEHQTKALEGALEQITYVCPQNIGPLQILRNMQNAFRTAGYQAVFTGKYNSDRHFHTVRKGSQWISLETDLNGEPMYTLTTVRVKEVDQQLAATAEAWTEVIAQNGRVPVYGINFDTGEATLRPESESVLAELLKLLQTNAEWNILVEGHTDNVGAKPANLALSRQRAETVITWLVSKGVDKARMSAAGFGDTRSVADNATEEGRARNRRVEVVKL